MILATRPVDAYFLHPNYDAEVAVLPGCLAEGQTPPAPILAGEHMRRKLEGRVA